MNRDHKHLASLTTDIVASYVSGNTVPAAALPKIIADVFAALSGNATMAARAVDDGPLKASAGRIRKSVTDTGIRCFACGQVFKSLRRHLGSGHGMTPDGYRAAYGLPETYPLVAEATSQARRDHALKIGLGQGRRALADPISGAR